MKTSALDFARGVSLEQKVVHWRRKHPLPDEINQGHGNPIPIGLAEKYVKDMNDKCPELEHWTEDAK